MSGSAIEVAQPLDRKLSLSGLLDYFIPAEMQVNAESHRRARMFMLSHAFGPVLGNTIPLYLVLTGISRDFRVAVFFASILLFWVYPFLLRATGRYQLIAFVSVQNLIFCVLWACYCYGGIGSPFLPWILIFPLLAFLYLPPVGWVRNVLLIQIFGSVALFLARCFDEAPLPSVNLHDFQVIGMISMASVAIYFAMMSLYFAKMFHEQREFTRELNSLVSTSDNLRNLTVAANQASTAKADFVAGMSHELRTPLNAIIGYSQLLLEEARDEEDHPTVADLGRVHKAGSDLLKLIDDILAFSRIEAGKMPTTISIGRPEDHVDKWRAELAKYTSYEIEIRAEAPGPSLLTDWAALGAAIKHMASGIAGQHSQGRLVISWSGDSGGSLVLMLTDFDAFGHARPISIGREMFEHGDDASPTKYGGTGIEIALAFKFVQLLGGSIKAGTPPNGQPTTMLVIPGQAAARPLAA